MNENVMLDFIPVDNLCGEFNVPSYQRGYRWGKEQVNRLLDDILVEGDKPYCLQPIVVIKKDEEKYDLVDGQQRLTTLYLLRKYLNIFSIKFEELLPSGPFSAPKYNLVYKTRPETADFLKNLEIERKDENIDFWYISNAYKTIEEWFDNLNNKKLSAAIKIDEYLSNNIEIIWYEIDDNTDANSLFNRLNIGKIPLTNSELAKALFLKKEVINIDDRYRERELREQEKAKRNEIALQWDYIEQELNDDSFWSFLTNKMNNKYQTKIDLLLDLITEKKSDEKNELYSFLKIEEMYAKEPELWKNRVVKTFNTLKDWYEEHEYYHKIGYLITSESKSLLDIFNEYKGKTKKEFNISLDNMIRESVSLDGDRTYAELSYERDSELITKILLLFNIVTIQNADKNGQRFPFEQYKNNSDNTYWSLEHIHAQQSEISTKMNDWIEWIDLHIKSMKNVSDDTDLISRMEEIIKDKKVDKNEFIDIREKVFKTLSVDGQNSYEHSISNLALLNTSDNAALSNSTFDAKRNKIINMDKEGKYIPFCTKMVFLKYYTDSEDSQVHFWGNEDRVGYINSINDKLKDYLSSPISIE